jgi:purine-binding chemotaxis protein CheW
VAVATASRTGARIEGDQAMSSNVAYAAGEDLQILSFEVGTQTYCVPVGTVREIRGVTPATPLPDAPPYVRGVINLRGQVMPVIDLSERLGKGVAQDSARQVIIVVEHHDDVAGLLVDAVCDSFIVSAAAISPPPPLGEEASPLVSAVIATETAMVVLLAVDAILPERKVAIAA